MKLVGIANSQHYLLSRDGESLTLDALKDIQNGIRMESIKEAYEEFAAIPGLEKMWIDNTASMDVASIARVGIERGWSYVCSNKIAATGSMEDWAVLCQGATGQRKIQK